MKKVLGLICLLAWSCSTPSVNPTGLQLMSESDYERVVNRYSDVIETYQGLYNSLQASATLVNSHVGMAQLEQQARIYQWDQNKFNEERVKTIDRLDKQTEVFLSFYVPERKHDDLHKPDSIWKVFLDNNGRRFEGKVTKIKLKTVEVQGIYPNHNRFSTPYTITFPVSVREIEKHPTVLTLTGPAGTATLKFAAFNP